VKSRTSRRDGSWPSGRSWPRLDRWSPATLAPATIVRTRAG